MINTRVTGVEEINHWEHFILDIQVSRDEKELFNKLIDRLADGLPFDLKDLISTKEEHHGTKIIDVKVVGLCSKCRPDNDIIPRYKDGRIIPDEMIACLCGSLGECKHNAHLSTLCESDKIKADNYVKETVHDLIKKSIDKDYALTTNKVGANK